MTLMDLVRILLIFYRFLHYFIAKTFSLDFSPTRANSFVFIYVIFRSIVYLLYDPPHLLAFLLKFLFLFIKLFWVENLHLPIFLNGKFNFKNKKFAFFFNKY